MWRQTAISCLLALVPLVATAGEMDRPYRGQGYVFYGPGGAPGGGGSVQQLGGGGEGFIYRGLSAGSEIGFMYPSGGFTYGIGMLSVNGGYHFNRARQSKLSPFVTAGYSLAFREGHENLFNFGGGVTWWVASHVGIRAEFRDYAWPHYYRVYHSPQFHVALSFR